MFFFCFSACAAVDSAAWTNYDDVTRLGIQLENLSRELESTKRGLEKVHDRVWDLEHARHDLHGIYDPTLGA